MLDLRREFSLIRDEVLQAIETVCASQRFILGPEVDRFESAAAQACGVSHAAGCASGTDALWLALAALRIGPGDAVLTTPFSFFATVSSILRAGAIPVLADIDALTFNLSPQSTAERLARSLPSGAKRFAAIMPVHLYGQCADMDAFTALAAARDLELVEDAAQAFGASFNGTRAGALGDAAAFSFYPTKNLSAMGDAGLVTTPSAEIDERVRMLRTHGMRRRYFHDEIGWNSRMDTLQAAVLEIKLRRLEAGNQRRRALARLYDTLLCAAGLAATVPQSTKNGLILPYRDPRAEHIFHQYVLRAPRRDELRAFLTTEGIGTEIYYPLPLHLQESLRFLGYHPGDFPESERAAAEVLALPIYPELRDDEVETVVDAIRRFYA
ncbi:MAG TPA: DegT/DnrJ/EryC1/StrS family aminotransferase [Acidobacteriaceae bacterium]|jgi:dTDP-4-amino-4,6-dideoxygalactose transaminase|nr:DegT/DnrJ/EryC1/StrS family aminotransferase [Acidobacteriaceae bacterium]